MDSLPVILALGLLIGGVLGALGGGGAILTVPALVYVIGESAQDATTASLVIVGVTAAAGVVSYLTEARVRCRTGLAFAVLGIPATWLGSHLNQEVDGAVLLIGFALVMVLAAAAMILDRRSTSGSAQPASGPSAGPELAAPLPACGIPGTKTTPGDATTEKSTATAVLSVDSGPPGEQRTSLLPLVGTALAVGALTGFFGVGGGFVIVPALVLVLRLPMYHAVGTSLMIVALNSATALAARATTAEFDWDVIVPFTVAAVLASVLGKRVADRLPARRLQVAFAVLMLLVAGYTAWDSITHL